MLKNRRRAGRAEVRGVMELMNNELPRGERETQFAHPCGILLRNLSSACTIVSTVELVWKAMELLQLDEDRMLRVELSLQEVLLNGHLQPGE